MNDLPRRHSGGLATPRTVQGRYPRGSTAIDADMTRESGPPQRRSVPSSHMRMSGTLDPISGNMDGHSTVAHDRGIVFFRPEAKHSLASGPASWAHTPARTRTDYNLADYVLEMPDQYRRLVERS